ncbi:hypothetical protein H2C43_04885 [Corynebacterium glutamicum]|uniref:Uncharacterized protein n=1 Tax=Corynebacterium glutamicum (strain ATCC 13032 / DSM 20300 / JCM 1318 / BCRC 11384 / CCUG 27702 / LMG 3730 / NBRC 12168 / NCIMB 10025 / NRRL B-2784 / 534) TaxID=196627 RepID=Q8NPX7_CORGL|nr:hypothetical protein [Corynebacterium glutamicum]ARV64194.1 hypothetical protein B7P23_04425 [Corynebacterium glutamicum]AUI01179.1 hypothetical protein CYL77_08555 [Corynebacterium glutamicum]AUI04830.1 hypothetical protein C0I99_12255 [Corynebacterium glutamicum]MBA4570270.1 hypothetical protein [Corynebacterium glutamicum]MBA4572286.1 hypothetical protein [Corynebacterium glutamicum]
MTKHDHTYTTPAEHSDPADQRIFPLAESDIEKFDMQLDQPVNTKEMQAFPHAPTIFGTEIVFD